MKGILTMSHEEIDRIEIIKKIEANQLSIEEGAGLMGVSHRQVYRLLKRVKEEGIKGIIHKSRGKKSNSGYSEELKEKVIKIYRNN